MTRGYHEEQALELGLKILYSKKLDEMMSELQVRGNDKNLPNWDHGDGTVLADRDEGYLSCILQVMSTCAKHPGRSTWVVTSTEDCGYVLIHMFAENSVRAACARVSKELARVKRAKRLPDPFQESAKAKS